MTAEQTIQTTFGLKTALLKAGLYEKVIDAMEEYANDPTNDPNYDGPPDGEAWGAGFADNH